MEIDQLWLAVLGVAVVAAVVYDVVATTLAVGGGRGPLSDAVARAVMWLSRLGGPTHRRLQVTGVLGTAAIPLIWVLLTWFGLALAFLADDDAVVVAASQEPTTALGRIAYAGGAISGAGASLVAGTETWQLVHNVGSLLGMVLLTLSLTYLFQVVTSVKSERSMSVRIAALGGSAAEAVAAASLGDQGGTFTSQLTSIADEVTSVAEGHLALPMLELFHSTERRSSAPVNLARFDEILTILHHGVPDAHVPAVRAGRAAVDRFLSTINVTRDTDEVPPPPSLAPLREVRDDVVDDATFADRCAADAERRARLLAYVRAERWDWDDVTGSDGRSR